MDRNLEDRIGLHLNHQRELITLGQKAPAPPDLRGSQPPFTAVATLMASSSVSAVVGHAIRR
jgi:hypothetical protein